MASTSVSDSNIALAAALSKFSKSLRASNPISSPPDPPSSPEPSSTPDSPSTPIRKYSKKGAKYATFLDLPAELRNTIYELAVARPQQKFFLCCSNLVTIPKICQTNRQVRAESLPIFYGQNTFTTPLERHLVLFLRDLGPSKLPLPKDIRYFYTCHGLNSAYVVLRTLLSRAEKGCGGKLPSEVQAAVRLQLRVCAPAGDPEESERVWVSLPELKDYVQVARWGHVYRAEEVKWLLEDGEFSIRGEQMEIP